MKVLSFILAITIGGCINVNPPNPDVTPTPIPTAIPTVAPPTPPPFYCAVPNWGNPVGKTATASELANIEFNIVAVQSRLGTIGSILPGDCETAARLYYDSLVAGLAQRNICSYNGGDAIHVAFRNGTRATEHHLINFGGCRVYAASSDNYRGDWDLLPTSTSPPVNLPTPPPNNLCPMELGTDYFIDPVITNIGPNTQLFTETTKICGFPVRTDLFPVCGTKCCTLGVDGQSQAAIACDQKFFGSPFWTGSESLRFFPAFDGNPYNVKILDGSSGTLTVTGSQGPMKSIKVN